MKSTYLGRNVLITLPQDPVSCDSAPGEESVRGLFQLSIWRIESIKDLDLGRSGNVILTRSFPGKEVLVQLYMGNREDLVIWLELFFSQKMEHRIHDFVGKIIDIWAASDTLIKF